MKTNQKVGLMSLGLLFWAGSAYPSTLDVCSLCAHTTIASAVNASTAGDTIFIHDGIYNEYDITVDKSLTFLGQSQQNTIIDAQQNGRHFTILEQANVARFQDLTLKNGNSINSVGCDVYSYYMGGSICADNVGMKIWKVSFESNQSPKTGGAIYMAGRDSSLNPYGILHIGKSEFIGNEITGGRNYIDANGGAIACGYCDEVDISATLFYKNTAQVYAPYSKGVPAIWRGTGGAISAWGGNRFTSNRNSYIKNESVEGGAVSIGHFIGFNDAAEMIHDSFESNLAINNGGAIASYLGSSTGEIRIKRSTFINNNASQGGAINGGSPVYINNSTFTKNTAELGGALSVGTYLPMGVSNSTFYGNEVSQQNGGSVITTSSLLVSGDIFMSNNIFTQNNDAECGITSVSAFIVGEHNLTETDSCDPANGVNSAAYGYTLPFSLDAVTDFSSSLQNNGGFTKTHSIGNTSNAIDVAAQNCVGAVFGNTLTRDQRGFPRVGNCDIGAFEYQ